MFTNFDKVSEGYWEQEHILLSLLLYNTHEETENTENLQKKEKKINWYLHNYGVKYLSATI